MMNPLLASVAMDMQGKHFVIAGFDVGEVEVNGEKRTKIQLTFVESPDQYIVHVGFGQTLQDREADQAKRKKGDAK